MEFGLTDTPWNYANWLCVLALVPALVIWVCWLIVLVAGKFTYAVLVSKEYEAGHYIYSFQGNRQFSIAAKSPYAANVGDRKLAVKWSGSGFIFSVFCLDTGTMFLFAYMLWAPTAAAIYLMQHNAGQALDSDDTAIGLAIGAALILGTTAYRHYLTRTELLSNGVTAFGTILETAVRSDSDSTTYTTKISYQVPGVEHAFECWHEDERRSPDEINQPIPILYDKRYPGFSSLNVEGGVYSDAMLPFVGFVIFLFAPALLLLRLL